jgi:SAM-dependent methyltransferase
MQGYDASSYGDAFADVYDDWYAGISDVELTVLELLDLAGSGPVLELGVGTGRIAVPLAEAGIATGVRLVGIDASEAMLARLARRDPGRLVTTIHGDMRCDLPAGPFGLVFAAYNTLFNLTDEGAQGRCFADVADRLLLGGRFVVEAFVPDDPPPRGDSVTVKSISADRVVLSVSVDDPDHQSAAGQFVELSEAGGVRLRPWSIRYSTPAQLDDYARAAGFALEHRWESFGRTPFDEDSTRHVTVYRLRRGSRVKASMPPTEDLS